VEINVEDLPNTFHHEVETIKVCFPSDGKDLSTSLANSIERCSYLIILDSNQTNEVTILLNDVQTAARGAAIQIAQLIINEQINAVIVLDINSIVFNILAKAGIKIYLGTDGTLKENLDLFRQGRLVEYIYLNKYLI